MNIVVINLIIGIMLLIFGRKVFWLFVGIAGFMTGMDIASRFLAGSDLFRLVVALSAGIISAFLAVLFYKVAVAISGFVIGGYVAIDLAHYFNIPSQHHLVWVPYVIGGIIGATLILLLLDWALIVLSSLAGASLIVRSIAMPQAKWSSAFIVLAVVGILIQARIMSRSQASVT